MPKTLLRLPDNTTIETAAIMAGEYGDALQWAPMAVLRKVASDRRISEEHSTGPSRLLNGTRLEFLRELVDYEVGLDDSLFMVVGISSHAALEEENVEGTQEQLIKFRDHFIMTPDVIEELAVGRNRIVDYKFVGAYAIVSALGIQKSGERPMVDPLTGLPVLRQKSSRYGKAGDPMMETTYSYNFERGDIFNYQKQLGLYKLAAEENGIPITDGTWNYFVARDGGTKTAKSYGVKRRGYMIEMPQEDPEETLKYFEAKWKALDMALTESAELRATVPSSRVEEAVKEAVRLEVMPPPCDKREAWDGRRCMDYCPVRDACVIAGNPWLKGKEGPDSELENF